MKGLKGVILTSLLLTSIYVTEATEVLSDEELEDVSAQGNYTPNIINAGSIVGTAQHNNNLSVYKNGTGGVSHHVDVAGTAYNDGSSIANASGGTVNVNQGNNQCARNNVQHATQRVSNGGQIVSSMQNNLNVSVLIEDQRDRTGPGGLHAAGSAFNAGTNILNVPNSVTATVNQDNKQEAYNEFAPDDVDPSDPYDEIYQEVTTAGDIVNSEQRNAQASVVLTDETGQYLNGFQSLIIAMSAANMALNLTNINASGLTVDVDQNIDQKATNMVALGTQNEYAEGAQDIYNGGDIIDSHQHNENFSVMAERNAYEHANAGILVHGAGSALNGGANIATVNAPSATVTINQNIEQEACNYIGTDKPQTVVNNGALLGSTRQTNDNQSVSIMDSAYSNLTAVTATIAAASAVNNNINIASCPVCGSLVLNQTQTQSAQNVTGPTSTTPPPSCPSC